MVRRRQTAKARAASLANLRKARAVNSKITGVRTRRRRTTRRISVIGAGRRRSMRGAGVGDYIKKIGNAFTRANGYLKSSKIISRSLKGLAIPVGAIRPAFGAALESGGQLAGSFGYGSKRRMRGGRRRRPKATMYDNVGMPIF